MAEKTLLSYFDHPDEEEEDYIDMEVSSYSTNLLSNSKIPLYPSPSSPSHPNREFEFQMSSSSRGTTSPADELFYKGKLLPLHLPPRLQMVEKLLEKSTSSSFHYNRRENDNNNKNENEELYSTPLATTAPTPTTSTPYDSCQVSRELNLEEYYHAGDFTTRDNITKSSWTKKIKQYSSIGLKLKSSRAYLKSLFTKSGCSNESCATSDTKVEDERLNMHVPKVGKKNPSVEVQMNNSSKYQEPNLVSSFKKKSSMENGSGRHRRSFSAAIKRYSTAKISSSSSLTSTSSSSSTGSNSSSCLNNSSNGLNELKFLKRCGSVNSEIESSIQGAIAHCKQSQSSEKILRSRKTVSETGFYSLSNPMIGGCHEDEERLDLCRG